MEILKKSKIEFFFIFFLTFGYIFVYSLAMPLGTLNKYFSIPFRIIMLLVSGYIIFRNFENIRKRKFTLIFTALFWIFYFSKAIYSFQHDVYLPKASKNEYEIYIRILFLNLIPYIAILSINLSKEVMIKLNSLVFNFLLIILGISCLYTIFVWNIYHQSSGVFFSYYISVGHYGLSLLIISVFYYFQSPQKLIKPTLGALLGIFTIVTSSARSPMLAAFIILIVLLLIYANKTKYWMVLLSSGLLFIVGIYYLNQTSFSEFGFFKRMYDAIFEGNAYGRSYYLSKGWDVFKNNIFVGGRILFEDGMYPHNIFVEILMSMGLIGMVLFFLYFKDLRKFKISFMKDNIYYLPFILFFIQYFILVLTSYTIFANMEFWSFAAVFVSIILFCYDEKIKSNDSRGYTTGNH